MLVVTMVFEIVPSVLLSTDDDNNPFPPPNKPPNKPKSLFDDVSDDEEPPPDEDVENDLGDYCYVTGNGGGALEYDDLDKINGLLFPPKVLFNAIYVALDSLHPYNECKL